MNADYVHLVSSKQLMDFVATVGMKVSVNALMSIPYFNPWSVTSRVCLDLNRFTVVQPTKYPG